MTLNALRLMLLAAALLAACSPAKAAVVARSIAQLTEKSDLIVIGDVLEVVSEWNADHSLIISRIDVKVVDRIKGLPDDRISLNVVGGTIGDLTLATSVTPRFIVDDHVLLFVNGPGNQLTGEYQGALLTDGKDAVRSDPDFRHRMDASTKRPLKDVLDEIRAALPGNPELTPAPYAGPFSFDAVLNFALLAYDWTWQSNPMGESFFINANCADASAGTAGQQITALRAGANAWTDSGADFAFAYGGPTASTADKFDEDNFVFFQNTAGIAESTIAVTHVWSIGTNLVEWDMIFNDFHFEFWNGVTGDCESLMDLQSIACHEFGHALGLGHTAVGGATMFATTGTCNIQPRTLAQDDIDGVVAIYGAVPVIWVDFTYVGPSTGSPSQPYKTLQAALSAAGPDATIRVKSGTSSETFPKGIDQSVMIEASGGPVTIGQ